MFKSIRDLLIEAIRSNGGEGLCNPEIECG